MSTLRTIGDFPRNESGYVDRFIGTAYDTVKKVADNLEDVLKVPAAVDDIDAAKQDIDSKAEQVASDTEEVAANLVLVKSAANAAIAASKLYPNIQTGLNNTNDGEYFVIPGPNNGEVFSTLYLNNAGNPEIINTYPSTSGAWDRTNHTGVQAIDTITGLEDALDTINKNASDFKSKLANNTNGSASGDSIVGVVKTGTYAIPKTQMDVNREIASVTDWLIEDTSGANSTRNLAALQEAIAQTSGKVRLHWPEGFTAVLDAMTLDKPMHLIHDGNWILSDNQNKNILDIASSDVTITGKGSFDGAKTKQVGGVGTAVGGITANCNLTDVIKPLPPANPVNLERIFIEGVTIKNVFNWPISIGFVDNLRVEKTILRDSQGSPQFFYKVNNGRFHGNEVFNCDDGGFVFYRGNTNCSAIDNYVHDCNQGIGAFAETSDEPADYQIVIMGNRLQNIRDGGIGLTTGGTSNMNQRFILVSDNMLINCNSGNVAGRGAVGLVGAFGATIVNNMIGFTGLNNTAGNATYAIYANEACSNLIIDGNTFWNIGSAASNGHCIYLNSPTNTVIRNNSVGDYGTAVTASLMAGTIGTGSRIGGNYLNGTIAGSFDQLYKQNDTIIEAQINSNLRHRFSGGIELVVNGQQNTDNPYIAMGTGIPNAAPFGSIIGNVNGGVFGSLYMGAGGGVVPIMTGAAITSDYTTTTATVSGSIEIVTPEGNFLIPVQKK